MGVRALDIKYQPSKELQAVIGKGEITRGVVMKKLWKYIKANNLQKKSDKRIIKADKLLQPIFGASEMNMFQMAKVLNDHLEKV